MQFEELNLIEPILNAVRAKGYKNPTPIQEKAIQPLLEGKDVLGTAQTGTGKTAAYALPILQKLFLDKELHGHKLRALILAPTRELAVQIKDNFRDYSQFLPLRCAAIYGGVSQIPQASALRAGLDILVATPGRLLDLMNQKIVILDHIEVFVLDEADLMLDMGFIHDVHKVLGKIPKERQTMLFSATMPQEIRRLADTMLSDPVRISISPESPTVEAIEQSLYFVEKHNKVKLLIHLLQNPDISSALVFSRTKHGADKIQVSLVKAGIHAEAIHGNKSQSARQLALNRFKSKKSRVLVATDIAARGIDVDEISHVINFDLPEVPETYVHRIGRTGRAGCAGIAISFCDSDEVGFLRDIQRLIGKKVPVIKDHPYAIEITAPAIEKKPNYPYAKKVHSYSGRSKPGYGKPHSFNHHPAPRRNQEKPVKTSHYSH